ncbi:hypothetical protein H6P81_000492 [Aristolochia fimbriata]|uniref:Uncharacterized protein n=1 Tax=Aristolochia fimbriata TaxID=158543 RepID=A0AAV7F511_ARIFI|nr:hypothetical protein H6P81_000492 [Aristolochia fimbriata]
MRFTRKQSLQSHSNCRENVGNDLRRLWWQLRMGKRRQGWDILENCDSRASGVSSSTKNLLSCFSVFILFNFLISGYPLCGGKMRPMSENSNNATTAATQHSPWHSPVPYLFGGLAAMLGLIAFALLILACSYWKLSGYLENGENGESDPESGEEKPGDSLKIATNLEAKVVVIMAGDEKPTYLATPICSRASCLEDNKKEEDKPETMKTQERDVEKAETTAQDQNH